MFLHYCVQIIDFFVALWMILFSVSNLYILGIANAPSSFFFSLLINTTKSSTAVMLPLPAIFAQMSVQPPAVGTQLLTCLSLRGNYVQTFS